MRGLTPEEFLILSDYVTFSNTIVKRQGPPPDVTELQECGRVRVFPIIDELGEWIRHEPTEQGKLAVRLWPLVKRHFA